MTKNNATTSGNAARTRERRKVDKAITSRDYWSHTAHKIYDTDGRLIQYVMPRGGIAGILDRPPWRTLAGRRSTAAGRGHRRSQTPTARDERALLIEHAYRLRTQQGMTIREVAKEVGRAPSLVGRWLRDIPACGGRSLDRLTNDVNALRAEMARLDQATNDRERLTA